MKTAGIIGGIAPESTIAYYRQIIARYREQTGGYPSIVINSIDLPKMLALVAEPVSRNLVNYLSTEVQRLADAGADFAVFASNTPHIVFDDVASRATIPMISIVESACHAAAALGLRRVGLLGTRFTMEGRFYRDVFSGRGIEVVPPHGDDLAYVHDKYMNELVNGSFRHQTRMELLRVIDRLRERDRVEAVILGGTELPLILDAESGAAVPLLDTTKIHVESIVSRLLG